MSVDVLVKPFYEWVVDASKVKGDRPPISGVTFVDAPMSYIGRKPLTVSTGHPAVAYLGYARGLTTIHAVLEEPAVRDGAANALERTGLLLAHEHGFDPEGLQEYRQKAVVRFENPGISDEVTRVARGAPIRKLGHDERFVDLALRLMRTRAGRDCSALARYGGMGEDTRWWTSY